MAASLDELRARTRDFLTRQDLRPAAGAPEALVTAPAASRPFSTFDRAQMRRASEITNSFLATAAANPGPAGLEQVLDNAQQLARTENRELVEFALMTFITHHPEARQLPIPNLEERMPERVQPSLPTQNADEIEAGGGVAGLVSAPQPTAAPPADPEVKLNWFREDPLANDHHDHWHRVYPFTGVNGRVKKREGELFFYMHQQMLARYDAERLGRGLPPVAPLNDYRAPIPGGYITHIPGFTSRAAGLPMAAIPADSGDPGETVAQLEHERDVMQQAARTGEFHTAHGTMRVTEDLLGATEEASIATALDADQMDHHNNGHGHLAAIPAQPGGPPGNGVMATTGTAIRDPVFFRWHRHIDDISFSWQETQAPNDFSDAPPARLRKTLPGATATNQSPDIIVCFSDVLTQGAAFDGDAYGAQHFGGAAWDRPFASGGVTTDTLETLFANRPVPPGTVTYLDHRSFVYFLRVENLRAAPTDITVRIFLAPVQTADDRRSWIEMDKFRHTLKPSEQAVLFRPGRLSSVIRKPAVKLKPGAPQPPEAPAPAGVSPTYCDCGWPYNLLLPAGRPEGMAFRLFVMLTDGTKDQVTASTCGSVSFCGALDEYPDTRVMGYPFDRPFRGRTIAQTVATQDNMATRDITIKLTPPYPVV